MRSLARAEITIYKSTNSTWLLILGMAGLIVAFWFIADGIALRFLVRTRHILDSFILFPTSILRASRFAVTSPRHAS